MNIQEQITKKEKELVELKEKLLEENSKVNLLEIEGFTITKPVVCKTYQEAKDKCPKGFRLPHRWELFKIFENMENRKKLTDKGLMFFWSDLVEGNLVKGLFLSRSLNVSSGGDGLAYSVGVGRVVYIRLAKNPKGKKRTLRGKK